MKIVDWKHVAELAGLAGIIVSLVFVGVQLTQDQDIAIAQIFADYDDTQLEWARLIGENRELWVQGLNGEEFGEADGAAFYAMAAYFLSKESTRFRRAQLITGVSTEGIIIRNAQFIFAYPGLKNAWTAWTTFYRGHDTTAWFAEYMDAVDAIVDELESGSREAQVHTTFAPM